MSFIHHYDIIMQVNPAGIPERHVTRMTGLPESDWKPFRKKIAVPQRHEIRLEMGKQL